TVVFFFFQAEDGIRDRNVTGVQTCALPILDVRDLRTLFLGHQISRQRPDHLSVPHHCGISSRRMRDLGSAFALACISGNTTGHVLSRRLAFWWPSHELRSVTVLLR